MTVAHPLDLKEGKGSRIWDEAPRTFLSSADKSPDELRIFLIFGTEQYISTSVHAHYPPNLIRPFGNNMFGYVFKVSSGWPEYYTSTTSWDWVIKIP